MTETGTSEEKWQQSRNAINFPIDSITCRDLSKQFEINAHLFQGVESLAKNNKKKIEKKLISSLFRSVVFRQTQLRAEFNNIFVCSIENK